MEQVPLASRLSQAVVACTVEADNELERRMLELGVPGLRTSLAMWMAIVRHVPEDGTTRAELETATGLRVEAVAFAVNGLERWGFLTTAGGSTDCGTVAPTPTGWIAHGAWSSLLGDLDRRWCERFGSAYVDELARALTRVADRVGPELPDHLPAFGLPAGAPLPGDRLFAPLARTHLALTIEHDRRHDVPLALTQNVLRVLREDAPTKARDLPTACGIARETVDASLADAAGRGLVIVEPDASGRGKVARLTTHGAGARAASMAALAAIDAEWADTDELRSQLEHLLTARDGDGSLLGRGLEPHPEGWRAKAPYKAQTARMVADPGAALPHHPMLARQGAWPDGA